METKHNTEPESVELRFHPALLRLLALRRLCTLEVEFLVMVNEQRVFEVLSQSLNTWLPVETYKLHKGSQMQVQYMVGTSERCSKTLDTSSNDLRINAAGRRQLERAQCVFESSRIRSRFRDLYNPK